MPDCVTPTEAVERLLQARREQTSAAREAAGRRFATDEERREYMRDLARRSARTRRQRRLDRLADEAARRFGNPTA